MVMQQKRTMSAAGRKKIAAAQRARWAKIRAEGSTQPKSAKRSNHSNHSHNPLVIAINKEVVRHQATVTALQNAAKILHAMDRAA